MPRDHDGRRFLQLGELRVYIGTDDECEEAVIAVCGNVSYFADDVRTTCASCHAPIVHRPYVPQRPPKVCMDCARVVMQTDKYQ